MKHDPSGPLLILIGAVIAAVVLTTWIGDRLARQSSRRPAAVQSAPAPGR